MAYDIDPSREYDVPDPVYGPDPLGLEGITHSYAPWDNPDVTGDAAERYGMRSRDASGNQLPEPSLMSRLFNAAIETGVAGATFGAVDLQLDPDSHEFFGPDWSSFGVKQPPGADITMPFGSLPGMTGLLVPTARVTKEGVSMHGGVTAPVKFAADVIASPVETFKRAKEQLTDPTLVEKPVQAIGGKLLDILRTTVPNERDPKSVPENLGEPNNLPVGGGPQNVPLRVDPVEETSSQSQKTASVNEKKQSWPPENLNEGPDPLPLIKKPLSVAARPAAPVEPLLVEPPVQDSRTHTAFAGDYSTYGLGLPHTFFERHPVTAEGGGLMDLQRQADTLAAQGRGGDTMLVHMRPDEVAGLASLGTVTRNPVTGLPENFLGPALGALLGGYLGPATWGLNALATGAGAGAGQYLQSKMLGEDDPLGRGLTAGFTAGISSAALGGFGDLFGAKDFAGGGVDFKGVPEPQVAGFQKAGDAARKALGENFGTTTGLLGSVGGMAADSAAQQRLAQKGQGGIPIREASTYGGTDSYGAPRLSPRIPTGLDQADLRTYGFGPEQQFFGPRVRAEAGGLQGEDFATSGIQALLEFRNQNAADLQQGIDERDDPLYLDDAQDMTLTPPEGGDGLAASIVDQAIAALKGDHPQGDTAISNFIEEFGEEAFVKLRSLIMQELRAEEMAGDGGLLKGSDGGRDDLRRVKIDGIQDGNVSSGEYLWSADDTSLAGGGNTEAGARRLDMARKKLREKAYGTAQRPNYIGEEEVEEVFDEVMTT